MPLNNFGKVNGSIDLYRAAQPDNDGMMALVNLNFDVIFRLSGEHEGSLSLNDERKFTFNVIHRPLNEIFRKNEEQIVHGIVKEINDLLLIGQRILIHCSHGRDRTGLVVGAWQLLHGDMLLHEVEKERAVYGVHGLIKFVDYQDEKILKSFEK